MMFNNNNRKVAEEEIEKRRKQSRTYTEPLPRDNPEVEAFLTEFYSKYIFERALDFKVELETYSDTVGEHYHFLVPEQVSFDDFFSRYYYRCNLEKLMKEIQHQNEDSGRKAVGRTKSGDGLPLVGLARTKSGNGDGLASMASNLLALAGGGHSGSARDDGRRGSRRQAPSRTFSSQSGNGGNPLSKEREASLTMSCREARNEMALKLLGEARGKPLDDNSFENHKPMSQGIQIKF